MSESNGTKNGLRFQRLDLKTLPLLHFTLESNVQIASLFRLDVKDDKNTVSLFNSFNSHMVGKMPHNEIYIAFCKISLTVMTRWLLFCINSKYLPESLCLKMQEHKLLTCQIIHPNSASILKLLKPTPQAY